MPFRSCIQPYFNSWLYVKGNEQFGVATATSVQIRVNITVLYLLDNTKINIIPPSYEVLLLGSFAKQCTGRDPYTTTCRNNKLILSKNETYIDFQKSVFKH